MDGRARRARWRGSASRPPGARSSRCRSARSSTGSWPRGADGTPLRPALIWCDRRAGEECAAARIEARAPARAHRLQPRPRARGAEDRLARAARARRVRGGRRLRAAGLVGGVAGVRRAGRRSLERVVGGPARPARARVVGGGVRGVRRRPRRGWRPSARPTPSSARSATGCATRPGSTARRWWCSARATRWRRRSAPAWWSRAWCATSWAPPSRSAPSSPSRPSTRPAWSSSIRTPTPTRGCSRTPAGCPAAPTAGSATSSAARRRRARRRAAPTSTSC